MAKQRYKKVKKEAKRKGFVNRLAEIDKEIFITKERIKELQKPRPPVIEEISGRLMVRFPKHPELDEEREKLKRLLKKRKKIMGGK